MTEKQAKGEGSARYSDPITETGGYVGRGAVLYDTREPHARPCCARPDGRHLSHVLGVYEETETGQVYYKVADGTHTVEEWIHGDDLLAIFEPAGWSVTGTKPTYLLTRSHDVDDEHDLMTDGGTDKKSNCDQCEKEARWTWFNGMGGIGRYCDNHAQDELNHDDEREMAAYEDPITTSESLTKLKGETAIIPGGGVKPIGKSLPVIRTREAFRSWEWKDGES